MSQRPGRLFKVDGRPLLDSRAVLGLASRHELVPRRGGWDVAVQGGVVRLRRVEGRGELPGQDGPLYQIDVQGAVRPGAVKAAISGLSLESGGSFDAWPTPEVTACGSAGPACGCRRCEGGHAEHADHDDDDDEGEDEEGMWP